jgi:hypothetical protein
MFILEDRGLKHDSLVMIIDTILITSFKKINNLLPRCHENMMLVFWAVTACGILRRQIVSEKQPASFFTADEELHQFYGRKYFKITKSMFIT